MFNQVTIIGLGLIGSSVARAMKQFNLCDTLIAADRGETVCQRVADLGFADGVTHDIAASVQGSDFVVICVPPGAYGAVAGVIGPHLQEDAVVTDVGSVKQAVIDAVRPHIPNHAHFVPGHPIAGTENSGPEAGFAELFDGRWCILTPTHDCDIQAVEKVVQFWESCNSTIEIMDAQRHDLVLGITSHLPHLIAYTIVDTADQLEDDLKSEVLKYSASGFRDFTRIAASNPVMWRDVFMNNKIAVLDVLQRFTEDLTALQKAIRGGDEEFLFETFSRTRDIRRQIIELGQADYKAPGGVVTQGTPPAPEQTEHQKAQEDQQ
ncbi:MAG: prephenate/arogenate dehydrogenase family protein [Pseudomonadota bacterium]